MKKTLIALMAVLVLALIGTSALLVNAITQPPISNTAPLATAPANSLSQAEAQAIALQQVPGTIQKTELETQNGNAVFGIEITQDGHEYDVKIDALTGAVLSIEEEFNAQQTADILTRTPHRVSESEAIQIAREHANGTLAEAQLERKGGYLVYAIEFKNGRESTEVLVELETGNVLGIETENEDEDD